MYKSFKILKNRLALREMLIRKVLHAMAGMKFTSVPDMLPIFNKFYRCLFSRLKIMLNKTWF